MTATPSHVTSSVERLTGRVKWFNNKAGYGFVTITDGDRSGTDIFVHHSSVIVSNQQYKYLVQGEYVEFSLSATQGGAHEFQATEVSGIKNGLLMCETRREFKMTRSKPSLTDLSVGEIDDMVTSQVIKPRSATVRGSGPREQKETWTLVGNGKTPAEPVAPVTENAQVIKPRGRGRPPRLAK